MHLHLSLPDGLAAEAHWMVADDAASFVESSNGGDGDNGSSTASTVVGLLPLLLIVVAVYFLLLRPRQRQMRQQRQLQSSLEVGDEVMLTSGVYGFITGFEAGSDVVWVEIDDDVQVRVSRAAISGKVDTSAAAPSTAGAPGGMVAEPAPSTPRRPTLKGRGAKSGASAAAATATGEPTADEPAGDSGHGPDPGE